MKKHKGLTDDAVFLSRKQYGSNRLKGKKKKSFWRRLISNFSDPIVRILIAALVINILFTLKNMNLFECIGIVIAILISTFVSTLSEYGSENAFEKLIEKSDRHMVRVYRNSQLTELSINDIVVGDIILIGAGESVPADGIIIEGNISVDQSALNGESKEAKKHPNLCKTGKDPSAVNRVFRGSLVTQGSSVVEVTEVGEQTFLGAVASDLTEDTRESPLKLRLASLAKIISRIGYVLAAVVAGSYLFGKIVVENGFNFPAIVDCFKDVRGILSLCIQALTLAITVIVVAVPEGLPMMICVVLSSNMKKMLGDQILVKKLVGIETAGSMNILFCDKTGTITTGIQSVEGVVLCSGEYVSDRKRLRNEAIYPLLEQNAIYNTACSVVSGKAVGSNATDRAIVSYFAQGKPLLGASEGGVPFNSRYKYSAARIPDGRVVVKGAPEVLLSFVRFAMDKNGKRVNFDPKKVWETYRRLSSESSRLLAVAVCDTMPSAMGFGEMTFVGLIAIRDKIRNSAKQSVKTLQKAGVSVVMMTGDGPDTARAIALETGIIYNQAEQLVLTGADLAVLTDEEVASMLPRLAVLARALPQDKTRLVRIAQAKELVVGMTGDGVNDAPALKLADIGFAMGSGTDIAKEAGDIVILNNDISAIVKAVLYGRTIFKSIQKFIVFQLTMNLCAVGVTLLGPMLGIEAPITIIQMLWVNIIMDTLGGLAFAGESPEQETMLEEPKRRSAPLLTAEMLGKIMWNGIMTVMLCLWFMSAKYVRSYLGFYQDSIVFYSSFFSFFIFLGIMQFFNARTERMNLFSNLKKNRSFIIITFLILSVQLIMVYFGGTLFRTVPLSFRIMMGLSVLSFAVIPLDVIRKMIMRFGVKDTRQSYGPRRNKKSQCREE